MVILQILIVTFIFIFIVFIINGVEDYHKKDKNYISFKETLDLLDVPIVTFRNNRKKLHFLLDTGSDSSYIREEILKDLKIKSSTDTITSIKTGNGETCSKGLVTLDISYKKQSFENEFEVADMTSVWDEVSNYTNITVHGILGSQFLAKYKYHIDFENLIAYSEV